MGTPHAVMAYLARCSCYLLSPGHLGKEVGFFFHGAALPYIVPKGWKPCLLSLEDVCLIQASGAPCVAVIGKPSVCSVRVLWDGSSGLCHCSLGRSRDPVCPCVYLSTAVCQLVCPSLYVTLLQQCSGPHVVCPLVRPQNDTRGHTLH